MVELAVDSGDRLADEAIADADRLQTAICCPCGDEKILAPRRGASDRAKIRLCNATIDYQVDAGDIGACYQSVEKEDSRGSGSLLLYPGRKVFFAIAFARTSVLSSI